MTTINLLTSRLCHEAGVDTVDAFQQVFHRSPLLIVCRSTLLESLNTCDYFQIPFQEIVNSVQPLTRHLETKTKTIVAPSLSHQLLIVLTRPHVEVLASYAWYKDVDIVRWVHTYRSPFQPCHYHDLLVYPESPFFQTRESIANLIHLFTFLYDELDITPDKEFIHHACEVPGARDIVRWCWSHGGQLSSYDVVRVMKSGPFDTVFLSDMITMYQNQGGVLSSHTAASMASINHIPFLQWWHDQGYPFCTSAAAWAAVWGHQEVIHFLVAHQKPIDLSWTLQNAIRGHHKPLIHYLRQLSRNSRP